MNRVGLFLAVLSLMMNGASAAESVTKPPKSNVVEWVATDLKGNSVHSTNYSGKVTIVVFWATWCPLCVEEIPILNKLQERYSSRGVTVIGASVDEDAEEVVPKFQKKNNMRYPIVVASEEMQDAFGGIDSLPAAFIVGPNGRVAEQFIGLTESRDFEVAVGKLIKSDR